MTLPTGNGEVRGPDQADPPGTPLPMKQVLAQRNDANALFKESTKPPEYSGDGRVDMTARIKTT